MDAIAAEGWHYTVSYNKRMSPLERTTPSCASTRRPERVAAVCREPAALAYDLMVAIQLLDLISRPMFRRPGGALPRCQQVAK
jgi:hypothetical protein